MSDQRYLPEVLFEQGFTDLISVVPPGATISPGSKLQPSQLGKVPGYRKLNGTWAGYDWRQASHSVDDVRQWMTDGANVGLRANNFPALDIDCEDQTLANTIENLAYQCLGWAPCRYGRRPKRLLMYSTSEPFGRLRLWATKGDRKLLVEFLGAGQQYLVHGVHPSGANYEWTTDIRRVLPDGLSPVTKERVITFRDKLRELLVEINYEVTYEGDGKTPSAIAPDQLALRAPSMEAIHEAMGFLPNDNEHFSGRQDWLDVGYAVKAASGFENEHEARELFLEWSLKWDGNDTHPEGNNAGQVLEEFRRLVPPFRLGWSWLAERAREFGFNNAQADFEALDPAPEPTAEIPEPPEEDETRATKWTEQWLAQEAIRLHGERLRFVSENGAWYFWTGKVWEKDARGRVMQLISEVCIAEGKRLMGMGDKTDKMGRSLQLNSTKNHVEALMRHAPEIALGIESFDSDAWVLNTPEGIVNLRTGAISPPRPEALCSKSTAVAPDFGGPCPEWRRFLAEATDNNTELQAYLQRLAGYCLTGVTLEQQFTIFHGPGGRGKGTFKNAIESILGPYAAAADMSTFVESSFAKHPTDIASLAGARLVTATEANGRQRLDSARLKSFSGEDRVTAHFMRQDSFTYTPQFKIILLMNPQPKIEADKAMRRRLHLVPFLTEPARKDVKLGLKLKGEWPAIFAWMIEGCLLWQKAAAASLTNEGLLPPAAVIENVEEFFDNEDHLGRWMRERLGDDEPSVTRVEELWRDYNEWASLHGTQTVGKSHHFSRDLKTTDLRFGKNGAGQSVIRGKTLLPKPAVNMEALP